MIRARMTASSSQSHQRSVNALPAGTGLSVGLGDALGELVGLDDGDELGVGVGVGVGVALGVGSVKVENVV